MGHPPRREPSGHAPQAPLSADGSSGPGDDRTPGVVLTARVLLRIQGGLGMLTIVLAVATLVVLVAIWASVIGGNGEASGLVGVIAGVGMVTLSIVVAASALALGTVALGVTIPTFILAARLGSRRNGVRVGALVLEGLVGVTCVLAGVPNVAGDHTVGIVGGAVCLLLSAMSWTTFGLLLNPQAARFFRA
ncbi:hypothetical protein ACFXKD_03115 [Nocardiopsis aegyptia]|uniref:hypothetical protein n=1 Tax=Nocardiopsis aegyptia TaxID=220378 RepID=UPI00366E6542